jgi:hypothetical protein
VRGTHPTLAKNRRPSGYQLPLELLDTSNKMTDMNINTQEQQRGIFLDFAVYERVLDTLEMLKSINVDTSQNKEAELPKGLVDLLDRAILEKERMTLSYQKKVFLAVVPIEDVEVCKQLKECIERYTKQPVKTIRADETLEEFLETVVQEMARLTLNYQDKLWLAIAPIEDVYLIEELEDCIDSADARDALKEADEKGTISSEQLDKEVGW